MTVRVYIFEWCVDHDADDWDGDHWRRTLVIGRSRSHARDVFETDHGASVDRRGGYRQTNIRAVAGCTEIDP